MRLASLREPFDHPDWIFELKYDGFRALAEVRSGECRLISRNQKTYKSFGQLCAELARISRDCTLDGEIVCVDSDGRPQFYDLLRHRSEAAFVAFDILDVDGRDLRGLPLIERKRILHATVVPGGRLLCPNHIEGRGVALFQRACELDLEGVVGKWKHGPYLHGDQQPKERALTRHLHNPNALAKLTWLKIKNPSYTQMEGREMLFDARFRQ
jgi:bifunctional non-homologous end joining protein LigD